MADKLKNLSDAILLGSTFRGQSRSDLYANGRTCAIGAAAEAIGIDIVENADNNYKVEIELEKRFPIMDEDIRLSCPSPLCYEHACSIHDMVVHLNDSHHWTRERIAAFLKTKGL